MLHQWLVGTAAGAIALRARDLMNATWRVATNLETVGFEAEGILARQLLPLVGRPGSTFIDVGAHIGSVIDSVSRHDPSRRVIAIEAVPEKAKALGRRFPSIHVHQTAVGPVEKEVDFYVNREEQGFSGLRPTGRDSRRIRVRMQRLDDLVADCREIDSIKIDVEGAELGVLRGASGLVDDHRPTIQFESAPNAGFELGYSPRELFAWFAQRNYEILVPSRLRHLGDGLDEAGFVESHSYPFRTLDYFAVPSERRTEIRALVTE